MVPHCSVTTGDIALRKIPRWILFLLGAVLGFKPMKVPGVDVVVVVENKKIQKRGNRFRQPWCFIHHDEKTISIFVVSWGLL